MYLRNTIISIFVGFTLLPVVAAQQLRNTDSPQVIRDIDVAGTSLTDLFVPHSVDGEIIGYKARPKILERGLSRFGLHPEDVITKLNGVELVNDENLIRALKKLVNSPQLKVDLLRDGKRIVISIPIN